VCVRLRRWGSIPARAQRLDEMFSEPFELAPGLSL
jgi:hypothetical protein